MGLFPANDLTSVNKKLNDLKKDLLYLRPEWMSNWSEDDATPAIQSCIDTLYAAGGGVVKLGDKTYNIDQINLKHNVALRGNSRNKTVLRRLANCTTYSVVDISDDDASYCEVSNLSIDGNEANNTLGNGIWVHRPYQPTSGDFDTYAYIHNVNIYDCPQSGVYAGTSAGLNSRESRFDNVNVYSCGSHGFRIGSTDMYFHMCTSSNNVEHGFYLDGSAGDLRFVNCKAFWNHKTNLTAYNSRCTTFTSCSFQESYTHGVYIDTCERISLINCHIASNGINPVNTSYAIGIKNSTKIRIIGEVLDFYQDRDTPSITSIGALWIRGSSSILDINIMTDSHFTNANYVTFESPASTSIYNNSNVYFNCTKMTV